MAEIMWQWEYPHTGSRGGEQEVGPSYETSKMFPSDDDTVTPVMMTQLLQQGSTFRKSHNLPKQGRKLESQCSNI